ncbi:MAG TPA: hypothetical protein VN605_01580, partial [Thermoanaerobaculia bacterium]|nr:hypothetical protein [Thermoanaerobaculia bacterium]
GLATPYCPASSIVTDGFKAGTEPSIPCPLHSPQAAPPLGVDQFGNPISLDTAVTSTDVSVDQAPPPISITPPPDSTLTGGVFNTQTAAPPPPPPPREPEPQPPPDSSPQPSTNTSPPPTQT